MGRLSWSDLSSTGKFTLPFVSKLLLIVYWVFATALFAEQLLELLLHTDYIYTLDVTWSFVVLAIQIAACAFFSWDAVTTEVGGWEGGKERGAILSLSLFFSFPPPPPPPPTHPHPPNPPRK